MKNKSVRYGALIIGLFAALLIIISPSIAVEEKAATQQQTTSDEDDQSGDYATITISATNFPTSIGVGFTQQASCLFEVIFSTKESSIESVLSVLPANKFFSRLLRVIISPNAP